MDSQPFPFFLHAVSVVSLIVATASACVIVLDEIRRPQAMWIMNLVWPLTALFGSVLWLWFYARYGRTSPHMAHAQGRKRSDPIVVARATTHCGAGCTLGDLIGEGFVLFVPTLAILTGWETLFQDKIFASWIIDFVFAYLGGIVIQYFTIAPMRHMSFKDGLIRALKADTASIAAWQVGMYGVMGIIQFLWFSRSYGHSAQASTPEFWFAMQIAMLAGFVVSYPVNAILLKVGIKEPM